MACKTIHQTIWDKLTEGLDPLHLLVDNESENHNVPPGSESHFKVVIVTDCFEDQPLVQRHRMVNKLLVTELAGPVHALSLHAYTAEDWARRFGDTPMSPPCLGGA